MTPKTKPTKPTAKPKPKAAKPSKPSKPSKPEKETDIHALPPNAKLMTPIIENPQYGDKRAVECNGLVITQAWIGGKWLHYAIRQKVPSDDLCHENPPKTPKHYPQEGEKRLVVYRGEEFQQVFVCGKWKFAPKDESTHLHDNKLQQKDKTAKPKDGDERIVIHRGKKVLQICFDGKWRVAPSFRHNEPSGALQAGMDAIGQTLQDGKTTTYTYRTPEEVAAERCDDHIANALGELLSQSTRLHFCMPPGSRQRKENRALIDEVAKRLKEIMPE